MQKRPYPTTTVGDILDALSGFPRDTPITIEGLTFGRIKVLDRDDPDCPVLLNMEFNEASAYDPETREIIFTIPDRSSAG